VPPAALWLGSTLAWAARRSTHSFTQRECQSVPRSPASRIFWLVFPVVRSSTLLSMKLSPAGTRGARRRSEDISMVRLNQLEPGICAGLIVTRITLDTFV
jgi:hypothetical protein